ncbi:hypothetical protein P3W53_28670 [Pseudomonas denitrificans (nom. rej.)]|nr:hypothetical protein [Pseudomonas denitrificans (nom. rej.)]
MNTSNLRHILSRDQVLVAYASDQIARTSLSQDDFAQSLSRALYDKCPEKAAEKEVPDFESELLRCNVPEFVKATGRWLKRVQRLLSGDQEMPAWMEEGWVAALEPDWRERCLLELAARYDLVGARASAVEACPVGAFAQLVTRLGQAIELGSEVLADGKIDAADMPHLPEFIARLLAVESRACELRRKAENELAANAGAQALALVR